VEFALAAAFAVGLAIDFEVDEDAVAVHFLDPGADDEAFAQAEGAFELDGGFANDPAVALVEEGFHGHAVAARHLVVSGGEDIIQVTAGVDMFVHVDVVRADLEFCFEAGFGEGRVWLHG